MKHIWNKILYLMELQRWNKKFYYISNILLARILFWGKKKTTKGLWLIANGEDTFGNNVKYMYEYLHNNTNVQLYWICDKKNMPILRQKGISNLVIRGSLKNYYLAQIAEVGIYTHNDSDIAPKWYRWFPRKTVLVDLTHGDMGNKILAPDYISDFALDIWCCSSEFERQLVIRAGCAPERAIITGMARYDGILEREIYRRPQKVLLMPTWREWYFNGDKDFKKTELFKQYNRLISFLKELGYDVTFILHHCFSEYYKEDIKRIWPDIYVVENSSRIQSELLDNDLLITDYSSVLFEFIYQRKPLILFWYDEKEYNMLSGKRVRSGGTYPEFQKIMESYICRTSTELEDRLITYRKGKEIPIPPKDIFFKFSDQNNCYRIYLAILSALQNVQNEK